MGKIGFKVNEAPAALIRNGKVFITYSASATDENYAMGLLWADEESDLLNGYSWNKLKEPVFSSSERNSLYGPGHNSFTIDEEGKQDILVYHARPEKMIIVIHWKIQTDMRMFSHLHGIKWTA